MEEVLNLICPSVVADVSTFDTTFRKALEKIGFHPVFTHAVPFHS